MAFIGRCSGHAEVAGQKLSPELWWGWAVVIVTSFLLFYFFTRLSLDTWNMMYIQGSNIWLQVAIRMKNKIFSSVTGSAVTTLVRTYICAGCHTTEVRQDCRKICAPSLASLPGCQIPTLCHNPSASDTDAQGILWHLYGTHQASS